MMASHRWEAACFLSREELRCAVPGQEVIDPVDGMLGDVGQHMAQPGFGGDAVELGRADQRVDRGGALAAAVGAGEQVVAAADGNTAQGPLSGRIIDLDDAVVAVAQQRRPQVERVLDRRRRVRLARQFFERGAHLLVDEAAGGQVMDGGAVQRS